jgi:4'-phosphopantetheinyl transferase
MALSSPSHQSLNPEWEGEHAVHIWVIPFPETPAPDLEPLAKCFSTQERAKLQRFNRSASRQAFLVSRGSLRHLLGAYLHQPPKALEFSYGPQGKPSLKQPDSEVSPSSSTPQMGLQFNLSHSGSWVAIALTQGHPVGIDIEQVRSLGQLPGLCQRCLTPTETKTLEGLDPTQANRRFLQHWTGKEAYLKALGVGLMASMTTIELAVPFHPLGPKPLSIASPTLGQQGWHIYQWQPAPDCIGAIALQLEATQASPQLQIYQITPAQLLQASSFT